MDHHMRVIPFAKVDDSTETLTVPDEREWRINAFYASITTDATAGNRLFTIQVLDPGGSVIAYEVVFLAIPASQTADRLHGHIGLLYPVETVAGQQYVGLPDIWIPPKYKVKVFDSAAVAAAGDDMLFTLWIEERSEAK